MQASSAHVHLRESHSCPAPVSMTGPLFHEARALAQDARAGRATLPRSRASKDPSKEAGKDRLRAAKTTRQLQALISLRITEINNSNTTGSDANEASKFMKYRHFAIQQNVRPIRWRLKTHKDDPIAMQEEVVFFKRFIAWGSMFWNSYEVLAQAVSAVKTVHKKMGIDFPEMKEAMDFLHDCRKRKNMESGGSKERDEFENFEMNMLQDASQKIQAQLRGEIRAMKAAKRAAGLVSNKNARVKLTAKIKEKSRELARELGMEFTAAVQRQLGSRPGEVCPGDEGFKSFWGGARGTNLHWTKRNLRLIAAIPDGSVGLITPCLAKSWFTVGNKVKDQRSQKKALVSLAGEQGRRGVVQIARLLLAADELQEGEDESRVPIVRDPLHFGGTGKSMCSENFNAWTKKAWQALRVDGDAREMLGYSWKRSVSNAMGDVNLGSAEEQDASRFVGGASASAARVPKQAEYRKRLHGQHSNEIVLTYDERNACEVARAALLATGATFTPMSGCKELLSGMAEDLQATPLAVAMARGWRSDSLQAARRSAQCAKEIEDARPTIELAMTNTVDVSVAAEDFMKDKEAAARVQLLGVAQAAAELNAKHTAAVSAAGAAEVTAQTHRDEEFAANSAAEDVNADNQAREEEMADDDGVVCTQEGAIMAALGYSSSKLSKDLRDADEGRDGDGVSAMP